MFGVVEKSNVVFAIPKEKPPNDPANIRKQKMVNVSEI